MSTTLAKERKTERIEIRLTPGAKRIIQDAAAAKHTDVSDFMLNTSLVEAEIALANRSHFLMGKTSWEKFIKLLDAPTEPSKALRKLMTTPSAIER
jgi:uncharacterized protein (DUF1778 family)